MASICGSPVCAGGKPKLKFTYTGDYVVRKDGVVELLTSGTLVFLEPMVIDVFCVGGGGGGGWNPQSTEDASSGISYGGGGGGRTARMLKQSVSGNYQITIGDGGPRGTDGGATSFGNLLTATGGNGAPSTRLSTTSGGGGAGGSGGGGGIVNVSTGGEGGTDGGNGIAGYPATSHQGGAGQGGTTREFGEPTGKLYAGGGGGGRTMISQTPIVSIGGAGGGGSGGWVNPSNWRELYQAAAAGVANTGGGGGGGYQISQTVMRPGASGGSGICCFRDAAPLPELAGTWVLNNRLYAPAVTQVISGTIATAQGNAPLFSIQYTNNKLHFYINQVTIYSTYDFSTTQWANKVNTITFPAGATASDEFRAWLASNATKQA